MIPKLTTKVIICERCFPLLQNLESSSSLGNASFENGQLYMYLQQRKTKPNFAPTYQGCLTV